uniref:ATP synthase complex subunit 8 n=1 Tax=Puerulus angulatus TaxID=198227 RepID=A0A411ATR1_9EUCA|nr:ATP synthase F0 subunit 8 [Puerulus angulatus]QAX91402.1 ATP synthase F0 subunit 8 [Puerulus angulatus]
MPQMSPMLWLNLFALFLLSFFCFMILNYFILNPKKAPGTIEASLSKEKIWKW